MQAAGKRNKLVKIQRPVTTVDAIGQPVPGWVDVVSVWANIRNRTGSEILRADRETSVVQTSIRINKRSDVTAAMRVLYGTTAYQIKAVLPDDEYNERMDLVCEVVR